VLFEVVADLWPDLLSRVGCRADRLKDEFFAEISATHETVSVVRDLELRLRQQDTLVVSDTGTAGVEEAGGDAVASVGGAAVAAASCH